MARIANHDFKLPLIFERGGGNVNYENVKMEKENFVYFEKREDWRKWLANNFEKKREVWFVFPKKSSGQLGISYNDAVEEALCFGWIDSTVRALDENRKIQRFTPRKLKSNYSQPNIERLKWLFDNGMIHPSIIERVKPIIQKEFIFPADIMDVIKKDVKAWEHYQTFTEGYKRIRIAYIDNARIRPQEFNKRLENFIGKTKQGKRIGGFGGVEKYYLATP